MAGEVEVTFRGVFVLELPLSHDYACVLMPRNNVPRVTRGNERNTIPKYETYIAIPMSAEPSPDPDVVCNLPGADREIFDRAAAEAGHASRFEAVTRAMRQNRIPLEANKKLYGISLVDDCRIVVPALVSDDGSGLQYERTAVRDDQFATTLCENQRPNLQLKELTTSDDDASDEARMRLTARTRMCRRNAPAHPFRRETAAWTC